MLKTVRLKILAMATALLAVFAATTGFTTYLIREVVEELESIAEYHIPLGAVVASIDVTTFEYELRLRRAISVQAMGEARVDELRRRHEEIKAQLDSDFRRAHALLEAALADPRNDVDDRIAMARVDGSFEFLERRLQPFIKRGDKVLAAVLASDLPNARLLALDFAEFEEAFGEAIASVRRSLDQLTASSAAEVKASQQAVLAINGGLFAVATAIGLALFLSLTGRLQRSFRALLAGTHAVETGKLDVELPVTSQDEIGELARSFNVMVKELRAKERVKDTFGKYLDPRIVSRLVDPSGANETLSERRPASIFFSDIKGFSGISENLTASAMVQLLNAYFAAVTRQIRDQNGIIDKFIGDSVMAFWTAPFSVGDHYAIDACLAALAQQQAIGSFQTELPQVIGLRRNLPEFAVRMGIATGEVVIGTIGSDLTKSYTVIGDVVNTASRLEGVNKVYGTRIIIDEGTWRLAQGAIEARELDLLTVAGKTEPLKVFELVGRAGELDDSTQERFELFAQGLAAYRTQDWGTAEERFQACLALAADDGPAQVFRDRAAHLKAAPPPANWDGVWRLSHK